MEPSVMDVISGGGAVGLTIAIAYMARMVIERLVRDDVVTRLLPVIVVCSAVAGAAVTYDHGGLSEVVRETVTIAVAAAGVFGLTKAAIGKS